MTLNTTHIEDVSAGNSVTTVFSISFQFYSSNELVVQFDDGTNPPVNQSPSSYVITGGNGSTGSITFLVAPPSGQNVIRKRILSLVQQAAYTRNDPFPSATHEIALDKIVMMIQQTLAGAGVGSSVTPEFIQDIVGPMFVDGVSTGITFTYNDTLGVVTAVVAQQGIIDAASDGKYYVRRNANWIEESWTNIVGKPATFTPSTHTHISGDVTDLTANTQAIIAPMLAHFEHINIVFSYDSITKLIHASVLKGSSSNYRWNEATASANPGSGFISINFSTMDLATHIYINNIDFDGLSSSLATAVVNDTIQVSNTSRVTPGKYLITVVTPQTGYIDYTVTADTAFSSGNPQANDSMVVALIANVGGITEGPVDGVARTRKNAAWTALTWGDIAAIPGTFAPSAHAHPQSDVTSLVADLALKAALASPALTGTPTAPTGAPGLNTTQLATTAFVEAARVILAASDALKAPLASPALTGNPIAPTATPGDNDTSIATTAFVAAAIAAGGSSGMTLLGTLTTTSGTTQSLTSLVLTDYKYLYLSFNGVSSTASAFMTINGSEIAYNATAAQLIKGYAIVDLLNSTGVGYGYFSDANINAYLVYATGLTTASTTFTLGISAGNFDAGSVKVYGVK